MRFKSAMWVWLLTMLMLPSWSANARAEQVSGTGTSTITNIVVVSSRNAGGNNILTLEVTAALTGVLEGTLLSQETAIVHPNGTVTLQAVSTFNGTANGAEGTLILRENGVIDASGQLRHSNFVILDAGGGLSGVRGRGSLQLAGGAGSYEVDLQFPD